MSTATVEKQKPLAPLGSFLTKLTPTPTAKPGEKATEVTAKEVVSEPLSADKQAEKVAAPAKADQQAKSAEATKESTPDFDALKKQLHDQAKASLRLGQENAE